MQILVIDDKFCTLGFALCCLHRVNELRYPLCIIVKRLHEVRNIHRVHGVNPQTKFCEVVQEFEGRDLGVKGIRILEIRVPSFVYDSHDEASPGIFGRLVELTIIYSCFVLSLRPMHFCYCCVFIYRFIV